MGNLLKKSFILPLVIVLAAALVVIKINTKPPVEHEELQYPVKIVEVIHLKKMPFRANSRAYGNVEPSTILNAKAEVSGKISYIHPALKQGGSLSKDTVVLRIEPTTFEFSLQQSQAGLASSRSSLKQLEVEERSTRSSLVLAKENLKVGLKELSRLRVIRKKGLVASSAVDAEEQKVISLRQQTEDLQGKLSAYKSRKAATAAQITQSESQLGQSEDTLARTEVKMAFDARVGEVFVEKDEFISVGAVLFEALGTEAVEIDAQMATRQFRPLLAAFGTREISLGSTEKLQNALVELNLEARVSLVNYENDQNNFWQASLQRIGEAVDPTRDTLSLVVAVDKPYEGVIPGKRPPLLKGMYVAVDFLAPERLQLVIPRKAIHQGRVYVVNDQTELEIRDVEILQYQGDMVVISAGVKEGDKVIVTDVIPVINGLPLKLLRATELEKTLARKALGLPL